MKLILRIILSPIVYLWGVIIVLAGYMLPLTLLTIFAFGYFITTPFIFLLNLSGSKLTTIEAFPILDNRGDCVNHLLMLTISIWGPFYVMINYIITGEVYSEDIL